MRMDFKMLTNCLQRRIGKWFGTLDTMCLLIPPSKIECIHTKLAICRLPAGKNSLHMKEEEKGSIPAFKSSEKKENGLPFLHPNSPNRHVTFMPMENHEEGCKLKFCLFVFPILFPFCE